MGWADTKDVLSLTAAEISPPADLDIVRQVDAEMTAREEARKEEKDRARELLRALSHQHELSRLSSTRPSTVRTPAQHTDLMNQLDTKKFALAKSINELEGTIAKTGGQIAGLKTEWEAVQGERAEDGVEDDKELEGLDRDALELRICRDLGFELIPASRDGDVTTARKILVRSDAREDVHAIAIDSLASQHECVNKLWELSM